MSLENGTLKERFAVPKDAKEMIEEYLTYKDLGPEMKEVERDYYLEAALKDKKAIKYAEALRKSAETGGMKPLLAIAWNMRTELKSDAQQLNLHPEKRSGSVSWGLLGLGEKLYRHGLPKEDPDHLENDPLASKQEQADVVRVRLGEEAYRAFYQDRWHEIAQNNPRLADAWGYLQKHPGNNSHLSQEDNLALGRELHKAANYIRKYKAGELPAPQNQEAAETVSQIEKQNAKSARAELKEIVKDAVTEALQEVDGPEEEGDDEEGHEESHDAHGESHEESAVHHAEHAPQAIQKKQVRTVIEKKAGITPGRIALAVLAAPPFLAVWGGWVAAREFTKTSWQSLKNMFGVLKNLAKKGFSFKALNEGVKDDGKKGGHDAHGGDHGKDHGHGDHGHGDHGDHGDHGHGDHGHGDHGGHGGDHGHGHGGGHAKKKSKGKKKKAAGGGHGAGGHH